MIVSNNLQFAGQIFFRVILVELSPILSDNFFNISVKLKQTVPSSLSQYVMASSVAIFSFGFI